MVRFNILGRIGLRDADGNEIRSVLAQPKRLALLAFLASAPGGFRRRDSLVSLFWPESSTDAARASLRTALSTLRRSLGDDVILTRGNEEVGVDPERLWCDAAAFQAACADGGLDAAELAGALALYRGDLLDGFHVDDAPEFERWLEEWRADLRRAAAAAARRLAEREQQAGNDAAAAQWARRALSLAPDDEGALRRLIVLLDQAGDRSGALRAYEEFAERLRAEFQVEPAPETQALIRTVCGRMNARKETDRPHEAEAMPPAAPAPQAAMVPAEAHAAGAVEMPSRHGPGPNRWPAPRILLVGAVLVLALVVTSLVLAPSGDAPSARQRVAVVPFENRTGDASLDPLGAMAADWIGQGLMRTGLLEVVPITSVIHAVQGRPDPRSQDSLDRGRAVAHQTGATILVSGAFYRSGDSLQFHARILDARTGALLTGMDAVGGSTAEPLVIVELLRSRVTGSLAARFDRRLERVQSEAGLPPNWEAYHASIQGIEAFIDLRYADARTHFRRATELDSTYAPAAIFAAVNHVNVGEWASADTLARALSARRERLAPPDQHILDWLTAYLRGDRLAALRAIRQATTLMPTSEWLFVVGLAAVQANHPAEAVATYARPEAQRGWAGQWVPYWDVLTEAHHMLGEHEQELQVARRARRSHPQSIVAARAEVRALAALGRLAELEEVLDAAMLLPPEVGVTPAVLAIRAAQELRQHGHGATSRAAVQRALVWYASRPAQEQLAPTIRFGLATALYEAERWHDAQQVLIRLVAEQPENVAVRGLLGVVAARAGHPAVSEASSAWLSQHDPMFERWTPVFWRARIAAASGEREHAVQLLRDSFSQGRPFGATLHTERDFEGLRGHHVYRELLRPKG
jgi:DNA-binding SARP family transcriptional activator/TolB-like protein